MTSSPNTPPSQTGPSSSQGVKVVKPRRRKGASASPAQDVVVPVEEIGGPKGPEPTRYGDWERNGRCSDF